MSVGENIQKYRKELGMSQEELGQRLFLSRQTISQWETDQTTPTIDNLVRLKEIFGISLDKLLGSDGEGLTRNKNSLDSVCAALAYAMGIESPEHAAQRNWDLAHYIDKVFNGEKADRVIMYNPDGIGQWIYNKYPQLTIDARNRAGVEIPLASVMPSVTPVCFATMYTGAQPEVHGIQKYEKPVLTIDTLFDALIRAGKKPVIIATDKCSVANIFLERDMDYFLYDEANMHAVNAKAMEVILRDEYDFIVIYNGNYDATMHKNGPESIEALSSLRANSHMYSCICELVRNNWKHHNTLVAFAMDHGSHEIDGNCGSHGMDMVEDINIVHLYRGYPKARD